MNNLIIGGILVTVMGGVPTVTYFLTKNPETRVLDQSGDGQDLQTTSGLPDSKASEGAPGQGVTETH